MSKHNRDPLVYILIRNHNTYNLTIIAVKSLLKQSYKNYKILIIDDGSNNNSFEILKNKFPNIQIIKTNKCIEYCKSFNLGIKYAIKRRAEYFFIINNDTDNFSINYLEKIVKIFRKNKKIGLVGSKCLDYEGRILWEKGILKEKFGISRDTPDSGFVLSRTVLKKIGFLNEHLVRYFEDLDLIARMRKAGFITYAEPSIKYSHKSEGTSGKQSFVPNYYRVRNIIIFMKKYNKNESFFWKISTFVDYSKIHFDRLIIAIKGNNYCRFFKILGSIMLGVVNGLLTPWREND